VQLFTNPFSILSNEVTFYPAHLHVAVLELKNTWFCMENLKGLETLPVKSLPCVKNCFPGQIFQFYLNLHSDTLVALTRLVFVRSTFSTMNFIKNQYRAVLTNEHMKNLILLGSSQRDPNIKILAQMKHIHRPQCKLLFVLS
jgi:hypothetical protein